MPNRLIELQNWFSETVNSIWLNLQDVNFLLQAAIVAAILFVSIFLAKLFKRVIHQKTQWDSVYLKFFYSIAFPLVAYLLLLISESILSALEFPAQLVRVFLSLMALFVVIRIVTFFIKNQVIKKIVLVFAWITAIFYSIKKLDELTVFLDNLAVNISDVRISVLMLVKTFILVLLLGGLASRLAKFIEKRLFAARSIKPSLQVLLNKVSKALLFIIVFFIVISNLGIKLTAFAFITGALGIGVGFGL